MQAGAPPPARSKELSSGPSSSQPARRCARAVRCGTAEKSGERKGLASCREITDCGTTRSSGSAGAVAVSAGAISSGACSMPRSRIISSLSDRAASETPASSASSASSPASRTAVVARMAAMPSRRLSRSARRLSLPAAARTRARSSRSSRATAWNFVRTAGVTWPRRAAASTSRAVRESTETTSPPWRTRRCFCGALRRAPVWRWPGRAKDPSFDMPGHGSRGSVLRSPANGTRNVPSTGPGALGAEPTCGSPMINASDLGGRLTRTRSRRWMRLVTTAAGKPPSDDRIGSRVPQPS